MSARICRALQLIATRELSTLNYEYPEHGQQPNPQAIFGDIMDLNWEAILYENR
jgi:hypothetical protein